jgi:hypothetical protein
VVRARSILIEVAAGGGTITHRALARRLRVEYDSRSSHDRHMTVSLLGAVADAEYEHKRPLLPVVVEGAGKGLTGDHLYRTGLLGYAEILGFPRGNVVGKFISSERKRAHACWRVK